MSASSRTSRIATLMALASVAFAGGHFLSSTADAPASAQPIVNATAWSEPAPTTPVQVVPTAAATQCNPWDVSDVAMEEVLREMLRRGWRPPRQGDAIAALEVDGTGAVDPLALMSLPGSGVTEYGDSQIIVLTDEDATRFRDQQIEFNQLIVDEQETQAPS